MDAKEILAWGGIGTFLSALSAAWWRLNGKVDKNCKAVERLSLMVFPDEHVKNFVMFRDCINIRDRCGATREKADNALFRKLDRLEGLIVQGDKDRQIEKDERKKELNHLKDELKSDIKNIEVSFEGLSSRFSEHSKNTK